MTVAENEIGREAALPRLLGAREAEAQLGVRHGTVSALVAQGLLAPVPGTRRYLPGDVLAALSCCCARTAGRW